MRVISGEYRGRKLSSPDFDGVRPTTDRVKESLFDILHLKCRGSVVIDLFSGSGALGIEALSRGAAKAYFCDINNKSLKLIRQNLYFVPEDRYEIIKGDFADCLKTLARRGIKADIILCDPPYALKAGQKIVDAVVACDILGYHGILTVEHDYTDEPIEEKDLCLTGVRKYGATGISIFEKLSKVAITGTFDPITIGHKDLVNKALELFDRVYVVILINPDKVIKYPLEERLELIKDSLKSCEKRYKIHSYNGLTIDYCRKYGIKYILRGIRNTTDVEYERKIAEYNYVNGGVKTLYMPAIHSEISSTLVRKNVEEGLAVDELVDEHIVKKILEE